MRKLLRKLFDWIFKEELETLEYRIKNANYTKMAVEDTLDRAKAMLDGIDISVDVHDYKYSPSWAVISLQGQSADYIKFVDLGDKDVRDIALYLRRFEREANIKVDATPQASKFLKVKNKSNKFLNDF